VLSMSTRTVFLLLAAVLAGCAASGPKYSEVKDSIPALHPEQGRIVFYRNSAVGFAVKPDIQLNGNVVGEMLPLGFFYVDRAPGVHVATARTEVEASVQIPLAANETRYVRGGISLGILVGRPNFALVEPRDAVLELADLAYTGSSTLRAGAAPAAPVASAAPPPATVGSGAQMKDLEGLLGTDRK
jgi:uncharacterized protein DUF2846